MSRAHRERRAADAEPLGNGSGEQFLERRREHKYAQLKEHWIVCPECGGTQLLRPSPGTVRRIPEASGACGGCGAAFASSSDGSLRLLMPRRIKGGAGQMKNLIPPESRTDTELDSYVASLGHAAEKTVRHLLAAGAGEAEIAEYLADLAAEPDDMIGPPQSQPTVRIEGTAIKVPAAQDDRANRSSRPVTSRQRKSQPAVPPNRIPKRRGGKLTEERHEVPPGVQGANTGYWQAGGVTRAGAKRSKRP